MLNGAQIVARSEDVVDAYSHLSSSTPNIRVFRVCLLDAEEYLKQAVFDNPRSSKAREEAFLGTHRLDEQYAICADQEQNGAKTSLSILVRVKGHDARVIGVGLGRIPSGNKKVEAKDAWSRSEK